jgi:hypothetical protein
MNAVGFAGHDGFCAPFTTSSMGWVISPCT